MSITDELRTDGIYSFPSNRRTFTMEELTAIADRIDAEYQKAIRELNNLANASVLLPVDADGEAVHIGDVMEWVRYGNDDPTITRTVVGLGIGVFFAWSHEQGRYAQYEASAYRHHHEPTVEDVLREMLDVWGEMPSNATNEAIVAEYAAKLRLADDEKEQ